MSALAKLPPQSSVVPSLPPETPIFASAWVGGAGLDRSADLASIRLRIIALLNLPDPGTLIVTNDAALLSSAVFTSRDTSSSVSSGIVLVTGTGAIASSYTLPTDKPGPFSLPKPVNRTSGWGYLLGDEGSAFAVGRDAIRAALEQHDRGLPPTPLHLAITKFFGCRTADELISAVYLNVSPALKDDQDPSSVEHDPKLRVAGVCRIVFNHGFVSPGSETDAEALGIVGKAASSAAEIVTRLLTRSPDIQSTTSVLVFGGALAQVEGYRRLIVDVLLAQGHSFARLEFVPNAAEAGIQVLIRDFLS